VQTFTIPSERGRGLSTALMHHCARQLTAGNFVRVYMRIWWNHHSSLSVAARAGRKHIVTVFEVRLFGAERPLRLIMRVIPVIAGESHLLRPHSSQ
jgi:hypothetical protein